MFDLYKTQAGDGQPQEVAPTSTANMHPAPAQASSDRRKADRSIAILIFILCFVSFAYFFPGSHWGPNAFLDLTRAIVEQGTFTIDDYRGNTGDWSFKNGHYYINKNPGTSFLAVPAYFIYHQFQPRAFETFRGSQQAFHVLNALCFGLFSAFAAAVLYLWLRRFASPGAALGATLAATLGCMLWTHSALFSANSVVAWCYVLGAYSIWRAADQSSARRTPLIYSYLAGLALGWAVLADPLAVFGLLVFAAVLLALKIRVKQWCWFVLGGLIPLGLLLFYNLGAFGTVFTNAYLYQNPLFNHENTFMGVFTTPSLKVLYFITFHPIRGIFYTSPVFLLSIPGILYLIYDKSTRALGLACAAIIAIFALFNISFFDWHGGECMGPRYLIPAMPFLAAALIRPMSRSRLIIALTIALLVASIAFQLLTNAVTPILSHDLGFIDPFWQVIWPAFSMGAVSINNITEYWTNPGIFTLDTFEQYWASYNIGELLGYQGRTSLLPLLVFWLGIGLLLFRKLKKH